MAVFENIDAPSLSHISDRPMNEHIKPLRDKPLCIKEIFKIVYILLYADILIPGKGRWMSI